MCNFSLQQPLFYTNYIFSFECIRIFLQTKTIYIRKNVSLYLNMLYLYTVFQKKEVNKEFLFCWFQI